jgi:hypothetical protein
MCFLSGRRGTVLLAKNVQKCLEELAQSCTQNVAVGVTNVGAKLNIVFCFDPRKLKRKFSVDALANTERLDVIIGTTLKGCALLQSTSKQLESGVIDIGINTIFDVCRVKRIAEVGKAIFAFIGEYGYDKNPSDN